MNRSRVRKVTYLLSIVAAFTCLIVLSQWVIRPAADRHRLSQRTLGKVNPVSGTAQLVLMGLRGVAVTFLWQDAIELQKKERYFEIRPVIESITLLQPNFVNPWTFQAWNMAYNIMAEWEAVADKYNWIRQGIDYMKNATIVNDKVADLQWYVGWLYYNRFGMTDEKMYLRELFKKEKDGSFAVAESNIQDNFEVAFDWYSKANETVRTLQQRPKRMGITPFYSSPSKAKTEYAVFLQEDGIFDERTKNAWRTAHNQWLSFGREGEPGRYPLLHKLEYTPAEWDALTDEERYWAQHYGNIVNYTYWKRRTAVESTDETQSARESFYQARKYRKEGDYQAAITQYERGFAIWRKLLRAEVHLRTDYSTQEDTQDLEAEYLRLLNRLEIEPPKELAPRPFEGIYPPKPTSAETLTAHDLQRSDPSVGTTAPGQPAGGQTPTQGKPPASPKPSTPAKPDSK